MLKKKILYKNPDKFYKYLDIKCDRPEILNLKTTSLEIPAEGEFITKVFLILNS